MSKKRIALLMAVVMVLGVAVGSTMAWLTSAPGAVTNTFTVGNIEIDLNEHVYNKTTEKLDAQLTKTNADYYFVPGDVLPKDPFVTVNPNSEACYVFVNIEEENNTYKYDDNGTEKTEKIIHWEVRDGWTQVTGKNIWYKVVDKTTAAAGNANEPWYILTGEHKYGCNENGTTCTACDTMNGSIEVDDGVTKDMVTTINNAKPQLIIKAYAHQSDNISEAEIIQAATDYFYPAP